MNSLQRSAEIVRRRLESAKAELNPHEFAWYPYNSYASIPHIAELLAPPLDAMIHFVDAPVLDVGCGDGFFSFLFEELGYRVTAIDSPETSNNGMKGVLALRDALHSSVEVHPVDLDRQFQLADETFGLVVCLGVLYHLKNPYYFLETLARHAGYCLLSTRITQFDSRRQTDLRDIPVAYLVGHRELNDDPTNYWLFSETGLRLLLQRTGWDILRLIRKGCVAGSDPVHEDRDERAYVLLRSRFAPSQYQLGNGWHKTEEGNWRWTKGQFTLRVPPVPRRSDAIKMCLRFYLPESLLTRSAEVTLASQLNGAHLPAVSYFAPGEHSYCVEIRGDALEQGGTLLFTVHPCLPPQASDERELGVIVRFEGESPFAVH